MRMSGVDAYRLAPHSKPEMLAKLDRRTKESRLLEAARASLTRHVGGSPNDVQRVLIERAARLQVFIELMDAAAFEAGGMSDHASRQYLAWVNTLRRCLCDLGLKEAAPAKPRSLSDIVKGSGDA
jgi:hypothetical protein